MNTGEVKVIMLKAGESCSRFISWSLVGSSDAVITYIASDVTATHLISAHLTSESFSA